jgi:transcription elongation factor Elf1
MVEFPMKCPFCNHNKLYLLKTKQLKCASCKKKFSIKKIEQQHKIIEFFCDDFTAYQTAKTLLLNYQTVKNEYENLRKIIANFLENQFLNKNVQEYDEYLYLEKSKNSKLEILKAKNFLTFHYENSVYNLLMPEMNRYNNLEPKDFSRFMSLNKISKLEKKETIIQNFWEFFENSILKYKGVKEENFFYYLKEIEFKFNYPLEEQLKILEDIA